MPQSRWNRTMWGRKSTLLQNHLQIPRHVPHTGGIALHRADNHLSRLETIVSGDAALPTCGDDRIICKSQVHETRLVPWRIHHVMHMRGVVAGAVIARTNRLVPIVSVRITSHCTVQPRVKTSLQALSFVESLRVGMKRINRYAMDRPGTVKDASGNDQSFARLVWTSDHDTRWRIWERDVFVRTICGRDQEVGILRRQRLGQCRNGRKLHTDSK